MRRPCSPIITPLSPSAIARTAAVAEVFDALSGEEQSELLRLLGTLRGALREKGISG